MSIRPRAAVSGLLAVAIAIAVAPALAQTPEAVSPGAVDRIDEVEGRCPTFIWSGVQGAATYELVVYRVPKEPQTSEASGIELSASDEVLFARVPGGATAWQPRLADGLDPGGSYVWFIRAVFHEEARGTVEASGWSAGRFFEVAAPPSAQEVEQALEVLQRWQAASGNGTLTLSSAAVAVPAAAPAPAAVADSGSGSGSGTGSSRPKSVPTATAAIKGSVPDPAGETYGVVGISSSPDGAGVAAANLNGGPDLVLDGSADGFADAHISEQGIDRPSGSPQTFSFSNTGGGGMVLDVEGVEVTTTDSELDAGKLLSGTVPDGRLTGTYSQPLTLSNTANEFTGGGAGLTGVDADTLDGVDGADYATDAYTLALMSLHRGSADHDGRYYTETELNTSGAGGAVHWNNLTAVPADFADGVDNEASFTAGPGIILEGGEIRVDPAAFSTRLFIFDDLGSHGSHSSIAIGTDGFGLISYYNSSFHSLNVAHCIDVICSEAVVTTVDSYGFSGIDSAVAIGADGLGLISYYEGLQDDLKVAHCDDVACTSATVSTLDSVGDVGGDLSITIGADGLGLISYYNATSGNLKVAHCNDVACSSATTPTLDSGGDVGQHTSIAIGSDGLGLISYYDATNTALKVAHCDNTICSSASIATIQSTNNVGTDTSITIGVDGFGLISYRDDSALGLRIAHCDDLLCSSASTHAVDTAGDVGAQSSIAIGGDGLGIISYLDHGANDLKVARCNQIECLSVTTETIDNPVMAGTSTAIAVGDDGLGIISYCYNGIDLKVAHLGIGVP